MYPNHRGRTSDRCRTSTRLLCHPRVMQILHPQSLRSDLHLGSQRLDRQRPSMAGYLVFLLGTSDLEHFQSILPGFDADVAFLRLRPHMILGLEPHNKPTHNKPAQPPHHSLRFWCRSSSYLLRTLPSYSSRFGNAEPLVRRMEGIQSHAGQSWTLGHTGWETVDGSAVLPSQVKLLNKAKSQDDHMHSSFSSCSRFVLTFLAHRRYCRDLR